MARGVNFPDAATKWEANRACNEKLWAPKERSLARSATHRVMKEQGEGTPTKSESLAEEEEGGGVTLPPLSPPCITLPLFHDIAGRQVGMTVGDHLPKRTQTGSGRRSACLSSPTSCQHLLT
jgi:hypothetical protein